MIVSILLLVILIFINGMFSLSELAFLSIEKIDIKRDIEKGNKKAILVNKVISNMSSFLSTIQIGITLAGFLASAFAADYFADYFMNIIDINILPYSVLRGILVVVITIVLSYFTLVFGELIPKKLAMSNPIKYAYKFVYVINFVSIIFKPIVWLLTKSTDIVCRLLKVSEQDDKVSEEDIRKMIIMGKDEGVIEEVESDYILNVFNFNDIPLGDVMTDKRDVITLSLNKDLVDNMLIIKTAKYSRYPVMDGDDVVGIINVKDLILEHNQGENIDLKKLVKSTSKYQYDEKIDEVFTLMQERNESIGFVYKDKEYVGIVTVEDAIEEIVGNIYDEYDKEKV